MLFYFTNSITLWSVLYNLQLLKLNVCAAHPTQSHKGEKGKTKNIASKDLSIQTTIWSQFPWKPNAYTPLETFPTLFPWLLLRSFIFWLPPNAGRGWNSFSHNSPLQSDLTLADRAQVHSRGWTEWFSKDLTNMAPAGHHPWQLCKTTAEKLLSCESNAWLVTKVQTMCHFFRFERMKSQVLKSGTLRCYGCPTESNWPNLVVWKQPENAREDDRNTRKKGKKNRACLILLAEIARRESMLGLLQQFG